ncbi:MULTISPECIES: universal stress protein [Prosthecochloris]|uniref:Universal stress protein n=1 Tax=Prosthecochloris marina TaxID=2017681 RepID=A0A317T6E3_9CHLB|nr:MULTISPECIES: universal stress protein [Prosthecochloris]PWW81830.1 universal stress protein UspA [Prosthecochloris marina]UZJ38528.1 universal stress protein [Prosthecochloris sp. SCSIO W1103]
MIKIRRILCPVDFSEASRKAVRYAHEFAKGMGASLVLLNVVEPRPMAVDMSLSYVPLEEDLEKAAKEDLEEIIRTEREKGIEVQADVQIGTPSETILEKAEELDVNLIIVGSHGKTGLSRILMGSVAESVVRKAKCPVLIVKAEEKEFIEEGE